MEASGGIWSIWKQLEDICQASYDAPASIWEASGSIWRPKKSETESISKPSASWKRGEGDLHDLPSVSQKMDGFLHRINLPPLPPTLDRQNPSRAKSCLGNRQ